MTDLKRIPKSPDFNMIAAGAAVVSVLMPGKTPRQCRDIAADIYSEMVACAPTLKSKNPYPDLTARQAQAFETLHELALVTLHGRRMPNGVDLGKAFGITREAAWKLINSLREKRYVKTNNAGAITSMKELAE